MMMLRSDILDFVEDYAGWLVNAEQAHEQSNNSEDTKKLPIGATQGGNVIVLDSLGGVFSALTALGGLVSAGCGSGSCGLP